MSTVHSSGPVEAPTPARVRARATSSAPSAGWSGVAIALKATAGVLAQDPALARRLRESVSGEGPPDPLEAWSPLTGVIDLATGPLQDTSLRAPSWGWSQNEEVATPALVLADGLVARGWTRAMEGDPAGGARDLVAAFTLGARLTDAGEEAYAVAVGLGVQRKVLRKSGELLTAWPLADVAEVLYRGLRERRPAPDAMTRVLEADCAIQAEGLEESMKQPDEVLTRSRPARAMVAWGFPAPLAARVVKTASYDAAATREGLWARCSQIAARLRGEPETAERPRSIPWNTLGALATDEALSHLTPLIEREVEVRVATDALIARAAATGGARSAPR